MNASSTRSFLTGASLSGAQGFALSFALVGMLARVLTLNVSEFNLGVAISALLFALAGALGAGILANGSAYGANSIPFALAGFIGVGGGFLLSTLALSQWITLADLGETAVTGIYIVQYALMGGLTGLLIGMVLGNGRRIILLILAGAVGFGVGFLVQQSLIDMFALPLSNFVAGIRDDPRIHSIAASLLWGVASAVTGLLGGMCLGWALEK